MSDAGVAPENPEATEAWNGPLFDIWQDFQAIVVSNAKAHGDSALADHRPEPGDRVLDIGCGLGDSTVQLAELVGAEGHVHGVDVAERMIEGAKADAERAGAQNVSFEAVDVQVDGVLRYLRLRVRALRDDVLRQPGRRASQRAPGACGPGGA